jgi:phage shock protein PspC (stress-responsive transcriptional regulator)
MEPEAPARQLTLSTSDKHVWGVAGGLGRYFGVDPMLFRVAFGVSVVFGGIGIVAYLAFAAFLPAGDGGPAWIEDKPRAASLVIIIALAVAGLTTLSPPGFILGPGLFGIAVFTLLAVAGYRAIGEEIRNDPARLAAKGLLLVLALVTALAAAVGVGFVVALGGGVAVAIVAMVAGLGLITAGLLGGPRWLMLPVIVLVVPLAVVSAADLDLEGGVGEKSFRPVVMNDLRPEYRVGVGRVDVDLRDVEFPADTTTEVRVRVGIGEARVLVPADVCASVDGDIGVGAADIPERVEEGPDIAIREPRRQLVIHAEMGLGHLQVDRERDACA